MNPDLFLYDSMAIAKRIFEPLSHDCVTMYVCGPTVYSYPHVGNARSIVVYDVLYRLLRILYKDVLYVRNITDVDDKIIEASNIQGMPMDILSDFYYKSFAVDAAKIFCLKPDIEPMATEHIGEMIQLIEKLIANGNAYISDSGVYFRITSYSDYGALSKRDLDELIVGTRGHHSGKCDEHDFVLWKFDDSIGWMSPWGKGRPGWHIECSAMSTKYLGSDFDIHGGGVDLKFPHHENEIAQGRSAFPGSAFARYWVHNGFVTVDGEKMSKSKGNHLELRSLLDCCPAEVIRCTLLSTHYRKPMDWNDNVVVGATRVLDKFYHVFERNEALLLDSTEACYLPTSDFLAALADDLNVPECFVILHKMCASIAGLDGSEKLQLLKGFKANCNLLGLLNDTLSGWRSKGLQITEEEIDSMIVRRAQAKADRNYKEADSIRLALLGKGVDLQDTTQGTKWKRKVD